MGLGTLINLRLTDVSAAFGSEALGLLMAGDHYYLPSEPELFARVQPRSHGWRVQITGPVGLDVTFHIRHAEGQAWFSWAQGRSMLWEVEHELEHSLHVSSEATQDQNLSATLPGRIAEVMVSEGQLVAAGEPVLIMEAMKLYHTLAAPLTGRIGRVHVGQDDIVAHGQLLLEMESEAGTLVMKAMKEN
jgi:acetyl/propionyl-CoA carboxylase alpha subunit